MPSFKTSYTTNDLQDIVEILEQEKSTIQEIELARNMIKAPTFNYVEIHEDFPFSNSFAPMLEGSNQIDATLARDFANFLFLAEFYSQPQLNPNLPQSFEAIHRSLIPNNSDIYQLENYVLEPEKHYEEELDGIDWEELLLFSKAEIHLLKKIGKQVLHTDSDDECNDLHTSVDFLSEGLNAIDHYPITASKEFNILALNSIFEQCKFYLAQQSVTEESAFLTAQHLLLAQTSNRLAEYEAIRFYEQIGELGTLKLDEISRQREKLNQEAEKLEKEKHKKRSENGGRKTRGHYDLFRERAKQLIRLIWQHDIENNLTLLQPVDIRNLLESLHNNDKIRTDRDKHPSPKTVDEYIKDVRKNMGLGEAASGRKSDPTRNYSHLQVDFDRVLEKTLEVLRQENLSIEVEN